MTLPRGIRLLRKHSVVLFPALLAVAVAGPVRAQDPAALARDSAAMRRDSIAPADSLAARVGQTSPTAGQQGMPPDSLRPDSLRPDSLGPDRLGPDSLRSDGVVPGSARAAPPPPPVDSALTVACLASGGAPPDLIAVTFHASATADERRAAARAVGGTLLGPSEHQVPGAWYVGAPGGSGIPAVADKLILLPSIVAVEALRCPS